jgi:hypothetical protein
VGGEGQYIGLTLYRADEERDRARVRLGLTNRESADTRGDAWAYHPAELGSWVNGCALRIGT